MFGNAGLNSSRKSNHSARKTGIQCLLHASIPSTNVEQLSRHKNVQSLNSYSTLSLNQQQKMSQILSKSISNNSENISIPEMYNKTYDNESEIWPVEDKFYLNIDKYVEDNENILKEDKNKEKIEIIPTIIESSTALRNNISCFSKEPKEMLSFLLGIGTINGNITINLTTGTI